MIIQPPLDWLIGMRSEHVCVATHDQQFLGILHGIEYECVLFEQLMYMVTTANGVRKYEVSEAPKQIVTCMIPIRQVKSIEKLSNVVQGYHVNH